MYDSGKGKTMKSVNRLVVTRDWREGQMNRQSIKDFQDSETTVSDTVMMDTCHYTFVQHQV